MKKIDLLKFSLWIGIGTAFLSSFLFSLTPWWQLALLAGILGGVWSQKTGKALLSGMIGVLMGWGLSVLLKILTQHTNVLLAQIAELIFGIEDMGFLITIGILLIGTILGTLGGIIGNAIRLLIIPKAEEK